MQYYNRTHNEKFTFILKWLNTAHGLFCDSVPCQDFELILFTVTDLANSCATPLFRRPQGSLGCLVKRNHPMS